MKIHAPLKGNPRVTGRFEKRQSFLVNGVWTLPFHYGIDWAASAGTPIYAAHDGTVTKSGWDNTSYGGGNELQLTNGDWATWYLHMQKPSTLKVGAKVKRGDLIGYVGSTGISTGPHLHFELHHKGKAVNPQPYLDMKEPAKPKPAPKPKPKPKWEDTMKAFSGRSTRKVVQKIKGGAPAYVTFLDSHSDSKWGDRTLARGKGDIVGMNVNTRFVGEPGTRINLELIRETAADKNRVTIAEARTTLDTFGAGSEQLSFTGHLAAGQLVRLLAHVQSGKTVEVANFYWSGMSRAS